MEAVSLTCDDTTSACPGTELTCICSVDTVGLLWHLPRGGGDIPLTRSLGIGYTNTAGIFTAEIIDTPPEGIVPLLIIRYNATQILCVVMELLLLTPLAITGFASKCNFMCLCTCTCTSILTYMYIIVCLSIDPINCTGRLVV